MSKLFRGLLCKRVYVGQINRWIGTLRTVALINKLTNSKII